MQTSRFQFFDPYMTKAVFRINKEFSGDGEVEIPTKIIVHRKWNEGEPNALIELEVTVGENSSALPFFVSVSYAANFKWEEGSFEKDDLEKLLSRNAPSLLLGYVRPAIAAITNFSVYPSYNLPFIDLTKENDES